MMKLKVITPEKPVLDCNASLVELPGTLGRFVVLPGHDALISSLGKGSIRYKTEDAEERLEIESGFVRVADDIITVCAEI